MWVGIGVGIGRNRFATGIFNAYALRVTADGGITEAGQCVDAVTGLLLNASLLLIPSGYKGGKLYAEIPTNGNGDLTWTRGGDGFRTNASGLIQRVPWNLLQQSETFSNATWTKSATTLTANTTVAPNGTTTADTLIENTANSSHQIFQSITNVNGSTPYTAMIYVKENASRNVAIRIQDGAFTYGQVVVTYNLNTGALISQVATGNAVIVSTSATLTNGYYLIAVSFTINLSTSFRYDILMVNGTSNSYTGDGTSSIVIWGAQLVEGTTAQTYLPTTDRLNFPRLSYMYGSCPAVLLEPQRTNLGLWSEDFSQSTWTKTNTTVTANTTTSPDGNTNADSVVNTTASAQHFILQNVSIASNGTYTTSYFIKPLGSTTTATIWLLNASTADRGFVSVNLSTLVTTTGTAGGTPFTSVSATATSVANGFIRVTLTATSTGGAINLQSRLFPNDASVFAGDGTSGLYVYGAQLEAGAYPTTYIPTTSATATRVADSFSRSNIYTNGLITASGGTWFVELRGNVAYTRDTGINGLFLSESSTGSQNSLSFRNTGGANSRLVIQKFIGTTNSDLYTLTTSNAKVAMKWNGSTVDVFVNGTKVVSASAFTYTQLEFLAHSVNVDVPKFIQQMALYPEPKSDQFCIELTTI